MRELMVILHGFVYFKNDGYTAEDALEKLSEVLKSSGINIDNLKATKAILREDFEDIDTYDKGW